MFPCPRLLHQQWDRKQRPGIISTNDETTVRRLWTNRQKLNRSGVDDAKNKYGLPLVPFWPLQHGNNIVVNLKRSTKTESKEKTVQRWVPLKCSLQINTSNGIQPSVCFFRKSSRNEYIFVPIRPCEINIIKCIVAPCTFFRGCKIRTQKMYACNLVNGNNI